MRIINTGHRYALAHLDGNLEELLVFVKREGTGYPGNVGSHPGTNIQEVLRALIDRLMYLDNQVQSIHTVRAALYLRNAFRELEIRAAERHGREWVDPDCSIDLAKYCSACGHIGCLNLGCRNVDR